MPIRQTQQPQKPPATHSENGTGEPRNEPEDIPAPPTPEQVASIQALLRGQPLSVKSAILVGPNPLRGKKLTRANGEPASRVGPGADIPTPEDGADFVEEDIPDLPVLIEGMLHQGSKLTLNGGSKSYKTWTLIEMALCVATGKPWRGRETVQGKVLFVNFELQRRFFQKRVREIMEALGITTDQIRGKFFVQNMRGKKFGKATNLIEYLKGYARDKNFALITHDPLYKMYDSGFDENSTSSMGDLMVMFDDLANYTGAAVAFDHHFSKGNQAGKDMRDRSSGSGVNARDPDTIVTMTPHKDKDAYVVECTARNFAPIDEFIDHRFVMRRPGDLALTAQRRVIQCNRPTRAPMWSPPGRQFP